MKVQHLMVSLHCAHNILGELSSATRAYSYSSGQRHDHSVLTQAGWGFFTFYFTYSDSYC